MFAAASISTISRFSVKSSRHSEIPSLQLPVAPSLHRVFAGSKAKDRSCGGDVEEWLVLVFEVLGFAEGLLPVFGQTWLATAGPLTSGSVFFAKLA